MFAAMVAVRGDSRENFERNVMGKAGMELLQRGSLW